MCDDANLGIQRESEEELEEVQAVYILHRAELCTYLVKKFNLNVSDAEDLVHSCFEKIMGMSPERMASIKNIRAFLYKAVHNSAIDHQRRTISDKNYIDEVNKVKHRITDRVDPYRSVSANQDMEILARALKRMPEKRRKLILMSRFDGLSYAEIARRVSLSETVVRKHVTRALADCVQALRVKSSKIRK